MAGKSLGDYPRTDPAEEVTGRGIAVLLAFFAAYLVLYALSYLLSGLSTNALLSVPFTDVFSLCFLVLALAGLGLIVRCRRRFVPVDLVAPLFLAVLVWVAVQAQYWHNGTAQPIPYYAPTFNAAETFLISLGAALLLKAHGVLRFSLAGDDPWAAVRSLGLGALLGVPFAVLNVLLYVFLNDAHAGLQDVAVEAVAALRPAIMEEMAFRLLFLALAIVTLTKVLPRKVAFAGAFFMAVAFQAAAQVSGIFATDPVTALANVLVIGVLFSLPMALLAWRRDVETAIGFHWVIDALRFSLGL